MAEDVPHWVGTFPMELEVLSIDMGVSGWYYKCLWSLAKGGWIVLIAQGEKKYRNHLTGVDERDAETWD